MDGIAPTHRRRGIMTTYHRTFADAPPTNLEDLRLAALEGEDAVAARARIYELYLPPSTAFLEVLLRSRDDAEQLAADFFDAKVVTGLLPRAFKPGQIRFRGYLISALRNRFLDELRRRAREAKGLARYQASGAELGSDEDFVAAGRAFDQARASLLINMALARAGARSPAGRGVSTLTVFLSRTLSPGDAPTPWNELETRLGFSEKTLRKMCKQGEELFRAALHDILFERLGSENAVREEIATLRELI